jgi:hypothetical protein
LALRFKKDDVWADVFIYGAGRSDIPDRYDAGESAGQLRAAASDIDKAVKMGAYTSATEGRSYFVPAKGVPRLDCRDFAIVRPDGPRNSILCVTNRNGRFVKIRITTREPLAKNRSVQSFLSYWSKYSPPK